MDVHNMDWGGLHQISWFQFLPNEFDFNALPDKSVKADQKDAATLAVLSAHLQLQKEGFLSTWTNSFVGPWDPSQGVHNPDEKIKLWLFLPGQHSSAVEKAQPAVARLRVLASGLWVAPGDSEEVAAAIFQALRNCIERALRGLSYARFGDVFSKYHPYTQNEELFRFATGTHNEYGSKDWKLLTPYGIGNICLRNKALLGKWWWRFSNERDSLWGRIIVSKYGMQDNNWDAGLACGDLVMREILCGFSSSKVQSCSSNEGVSLMEGEEDRRRQGSETQEHIFLHCSFVRQLWSKVLIELGLVWVTPQSGSDLFMTDLGGFLGSKGRTLWRVIVPVVCWSVWLERNNRILNDIEESTLECWDRIKFRIASWIVSSQEVVLVLCRKGQPVAEFIFAATEETIFVHVIISAKLVSFSTLKLFFICTFGMSERFQVVTLNHFSAVLVGVNDRISDELNPVMMREFYANMVLQVSFLYIVNLPPSSIARIAKMLSFTPIALDTFVASPHGMRGKLTGCCPGDLVKQVYLSSGRVRGSNGIVGLPYHVAQGSGRPAQLRGQNCYVEVTLGCHDKAVRKNVNSHSDFSQPHGIESPATGLGTQRWPSDKLPVGEKMFIYPAEAVLVPVMQTSSARSSLKSDDKVDSRGGSSLEPSGTRSQHGYRSSSNSNSSSNCSISSSSSDSDQKTLGAGDLEADADSLMSRQSGLSSLGQMQNDGLQLGSKRPRTGTSESFSQAGMVLNPSMTDYGTMEVNNMSAAGVANEQNGAQWGWDDDDRGMGMDIQALLSEFGDFGDFFENDALPFGEKRQIPTVGSWELVTFRARKSMTIEMITEAPSLFLHTVASLPCILCEILHQYKLLTDIFYKKKGTARISCSLYCPPGSAESQALMYPAPEGGELCSSPSNSVMDVSDQMLLPVGFPTFDSFNHLQAPASMEDLASKNQEAPKSSASGQVTCSLPPFSGEFDHVVKAEALMTFAPEYGGVETPRSEISSVIFETRMYQNLAKWILLQAPTIMYIRQHHLLPLAVMDLMRSPSCPASMCRLRHTLLSSGHLSPAGLSGLSGNSTPNQALVDSSTIMDNISSKSELKKKEIIPVRIAGDIDGGILDGPLTAPVGVWRSVGIPKVAKTSTSSMELSPSIPHNSFIEESMLSYGLRQPLQELLDGIALLVQQAVSFVDVALDADCGDGPFGWLALQEQRRRGFSCGPSMLSKSSLLWESSTWIVSLMVKHIKFPVNNTFTLVEIVAIDYIWFYSWLCYVGIKLVQASLTISLLQSEIKSALKSAFSNVDGPLSVTDWCRGRSPSNESGMTCDGVSAESIASASECRDSSSTVTVSVGDPMSPPLTSASGVSCLKADGTRVDEAATSLSELDQQQCSRIRPTLAVVPFPSILVGYQDDWLKTSASSLQVWEKAPLEPYATAKHMSYYVVCPNIDPLTTAAADFFLQLGTVYETCKLGTHAPQSFGNEMEIDSGKISPGFVLLDCPQSMKIDTNNASMLGSISDYFLCLSNGWDLTSYLKTLSKVLKSLKLGSPVSVTAKEGNGGPCTVVYVVCPFPEPLAVLQTVVESSIAIGSVIRSSDKERRSMLHNQVAKALSYPAAVDESFSTVLTLTGFSIPKLVLQIVTVDAIFRVTSPPLNELIILKEIAFTVYNKARRISRGASGETSSLSVPGRSHSVMMQMASPVPGMWKDCVGPRLMGPPLQRESELDASLRPSAWDNSWQTARSGGHGTGDVFPLDDIRCLFEPLFILAEPGSRGLSPFFGNFVDSSKLLSDDCVSTSFVQSSASSGSGDNGPVSQHESLDSDSFGSGNRKTLPSLHCCYGWTEDWRWMVCIWTDSRGELLDSYVYPFGGVSSRQDTKGLQSLFIQILQQGCQILQACSPDVGIAKPRDLVITRIGCFFELECQGIELASICYTSFSTFSSLFSSLA
ncbi:hypothetical protein DH2020_029454 [Rehmannia glutinosa]|uniref:Mediator of RNA polymerase II transcription subunit 13 n=1 Tax=Rehmannia glutinosa TaxID=99300 RepID=A0ABR0VNI8_REHGL